MTDHTTRTHIPMDVQPDTHINAPVNVHGWCFGLIPANGNWLDDIIDWHKRQFRQAAVARRLAACWNACRSISTEDLERHFGTSVGIDEAKAMTRSRHVANMRDGIRAALGIARAAAGAAAGPTAPVEPVGYLNVVYGTFFRPAELAATDRTRELMASGEIIAVYRAATPAHSNSAEDRVRSPYVLGVKPSNWDEQIAAGAAARNAQERVHAMHSGVVGVFADIKAEHAAAQPALAPATDAMRDVLVERQRQIDKEGWTPEHDDNEHSDTSTLAMAAACYASGAVDFWPWDFKWWKPSTERRNLVKAGALILADIERIDRAAMLSANSPREAR